MLNPTPWSALQGQGEIESNESVGTSTKSRAATREASGTVSEVSPERLRAYRRDVFGKANCPGLAP
jgi:hypothetical protein